MSSSSGRWGPAQINPIEQEDARPKGRPLAIHPQGGGQSDLYGMLDDEKPKRCVGPIGTGSWGIPTGHQQATGTDGNVK